MVEDISPETNAALAAYRSATGLQLVSRTGGLRQAYRLLAGGAVLLLVSDRVIGDGSQGLVVPFGDALRRMPTGPAALALATDSMIVSGYIVREQNGPARYFLHMDPPISPNGRTRDDLTRMIAARLEAVIRQHPDQWYVFQPDWLSRDPGA
jgi:KDO2-lipid IV(A) lauroyltransferase